MENGDWRMEDGNGGYDLVLCARVIRSRRVRRHARIHINGAYPYVMYMPLNAAYVMLRILHPHILLLNSQDTHTHSWPG